MKKIIFLSLVLILVTGSCAREKKSPIEGAWQMIYADFQSTDATFPAQVKGGQIKMWTNGYFAFVGKFIIDTVIQNNYGEGTYKLEGNRCEVIREYHSSKSMVGTTGRWLIEVRNDTLIQRWPADENWNLSEKYQTEKYVRLK